jgi:energy-converting hydrogenase Eha subunit E
VNVPVNLSSAGLQSWAANHPDEVICDFGFRIGPSSRIMAAVNTVQCGNGPGGGPVNIKQPPGSQSQPQPQASEAQIREAARQIARMNYSDYARQFLYPSNALMIKSGLWLELEAVIGFVVGLGLGSLTGQRTVAVITMIVLEVVLTPILSRARIPHFSNLQRAVVAWPQPTWHPGGSPCSAWVGVVPGAAAGGIPDCCRSPPPWPPASSSRGWWAGQSSVRGE